MLKSRYIPGKTGMVGRYVTVCSLHCLTLFTFFCRSIDSLFQRKKELQSRETLVIVVWGYIIHYVS